MSLKGLGRGLDALLSVENKVQPADSSVCTLSVHCLVPNKNQPRKSMSAEGLDELARSIRQQGIIQPIIVRRLPDEENKYQIIAGERRWRAAQRAGLNEVPVFIREMNDRDVMLIALIENLQREDLNPAEEALAMQELKMTLSLTQEELADNLGKSRSQVANALRLLQLPVKALKSLQEGTISSGQARCILGFGEAPEKQEAFLQYILDNKLPVRACEDILASWKKGEALPWETESSGEAVKAVHKRQPKTPEFRQLEKDISSSLQCKVKLSGTQDTGKMTLSYKSGEELNRILALLGMKQD
ncbi:MAG: ParB/RepB/Spo0J family partition protein [Desulfovibrionaceae bacterium]|nr:ParB/RepB/Spo0J family partition protein [Desulfovibrionaceae bacterium]